MNNMVKVWMSPRSYAQLIENKIPDQYWLIKPAVESIEIMLPISVVESWKTKVSNKKLLFG